LPAELVKDNSKLQKDREAAEKEVTTAGSLVTQVGDCPQRNLMLAERGCALHEKFHISIAKYKMGCLRGAKAEITSRLLNMYIY
jgi:hypothetical protein